MADAAGSSAYRYRLTGLAESVACAVGDRILLRGSLANVGTAPLDFRAGASPTIAIGARLYPIADAASQPAAAPPLRETRGSNGAAVLRPGEASGFELVLPTEGLTSGHYVAVIDAVADGAFWFADLGQRPHLLRIDCTRPPRCRYTLHFDPPDRRDEAGQIRLAGVLTNTGSGPLLFGSGDDRAGIGARIYRGRSGEPIIEVRGTVSAGAVEPGERSRFELTVPRRALDAWRHVAVVDLLFENLFWFADRGQVPYRVDLGTRRPVDEDAAAAPPMELLDVREWRRLADIVATHPLTTRLTPFGAPPPGSAGAAAAQWVEAANELAALPGVAVPISRLMLHLRAANRLEARWSLDGDASALDFAKWYLLDAPDELGLHDRPVPAELLDYLNANAFEPFLSPWPVSRFALSAVAGAPVRFDLRDGRSLEDLAFWWIGAFAAHRSLDAAAIPAELSRIVCSYGIGATVDDVAPGPLLTRFLAVNPEPGGGVDLRSSDGRVALAFALLAKFAGCGALGEHLARGLAPFFATPIDASPDAPTRFELMYWRYAGEPAGADGGMGLAAIGEWFRDGPCRANPAYRAFASLPEAPRDDAAAAPRAILIGMPASPSGLGQNARMSLDACARLGLRPAVFDVQSEEWRPAPVAAAGPPLLRRDVALFQVNPETVPQALLQARSPRLGAAYRIGYFVWEVDAIPEAHRLALDLVDEIWVPSEFVGAAYARAAARPVTRMRKSIVLPQPATPCLPQLDAARGGFTFLTAFDFDSGVERKNPLAVVRAFGAAFPDRATPVSLIVKTTTAREGHWGDPHNQWRDIREAAERDPRIRIVVDGLPFAEFLGLIASADCVVSAHRAEGFGYIPAYALLLARPLVVTDYSGTRDFCDETNAYPVRWTRRRIDRGECHFDVAGASWADIDPLHLAERLRQVFDDPGEARRRAERGRQAMVQRYSPESCAEDYRARLAALGLLDA